MINDLVFRNIVLKQDLINDKDLKVCQKSSAVSSGMDQSWHLYFICIVCT